MHRKPSAKGRKGKITGSESTTRFPQASCFEKPMRSVPELWGRMYKRYEKWDKKSDSHAAEKGAKNLVSSNFAKILD